MKRLLAIALFTALWQVQAAAADLLIEIIGPEMGLLDQELAKLAAFAAIVG